ncbi:MAG: hypothetical protein EAZ74_02105 [Alphaproteobacteria bacterium]|nr:MAG: hypothetical protein EAY76_07165 [Alphaproteobacteria bacterium]TAF15318.1 MAG: hypothetical protein EAZ74_02105 [Alphaproteobacteria bacterium]
MTLNRSQKKQLGRLKALEKLHALLSVCTSQEVHPFLHIAATQYQKPIAEKFRTLLSQKNLLWETSAERWCVNLQDGELPQLVDYLVSQYHLSRKSGNYPPLFLGIQSDIQIASSQCILESFESFERLGVDSIIINALTSDFLEALQ